MATDNLSTIKNANEKHIEQRVPLVAASRAPARGPGVSPRDMLIFYNTLLHTRMCATLLFVRAKLHAGNVIEIFLFRLARQISTYFDEYSSLACSASNGTERIRASRYSPLIPASPRRTGSILRSERIFTDVENFHPRVGEIFTKTLSRRRERRGASRRERNKSGGLA